MILDFQPLSDDQLIDLIRAACAEAASRNLAAAARSAMLDEAEKSSIAREVIERERLRFEREAAESIAREAIAREKAQRAAEELKAKEEKLRRAWEYKDAMGKRISEILRPKAAQTFTLWNKGDKRVYIGHGYGNNMVIYYHTGTHKNKPRSIEITTRPRGWTAEDWTEEKYGEVAAALSAVLGEICESWSSIEFEVPGYVATEEMTT